MNEHVLFLQFERNNPKDFSVTLVRVVETWSIEQDDSMTVQIERVCVDNGIRA